MTKALRHQFLPLTRALNSTKAAEAMLVVITPLKTAENEDETDKKDDKKAEDVGDGDVTTSLAKDMSTLEKRQLVETLNKQAHQERSRHMRKEFLKQAAGVKQRVSATHGFVFWMPFFRSSHLGRKGCFQACSGTV